MAVTSASLTACPHAPPRPLPVKTAVDISTGLDLAASVADLLAETDAARETREACIIARSAGPAMRSAATGVRAAAGDAFIIPGLSLDLTECGDPARFALADDVAPWVELWSNVATLAESQIKANADAGDCVAREVGAAVVAWLAGDLSTEIALELIQTTADGVVNVEPVVIDVRRCGV